MTKKDFVAFDTETHLIGPENIAPKMVCLTTALHSVPEQLEKRIFTTAAEDNELLHEVLDHLFDPNATNQILIGHNTAFDLGVVCAYNAEYLEKVFALLSQGRIRDTKIRELLLSLADQGSLDFYNSPDESVVHIGYSLADLVLEYLDKDISADKKGDDIWRLNYNQLDGIPLKDWPEEAIDYAIGDSEYTLRVFHEQELRRKKLMEDRQIDPFKPQDFRVQIAFSLFLMTAHGVAIDPVKKQKIEEMLAEELKPENMDLLLESGILIPAQSPRPHKRSPKKMTKGTKEKINKKGFQKYLEDLERANPKIELKYTEASTRYPNGQVSTSAEWIEENSHHDPLLEQFHKRQKLQKLVTTEIPRMNWEGKTAPIVHAGFEPLKSTGRVSSKASTLYPSFNCQNVDPRARGCYVPRNGYLMFGADFSGMELVTLGQACLNIFGKSVLAEKINQGMDPHAYLAAQLAYHLDEDFRELMDLEGVEDADAMYGAFKELGSSDYPEEKEFYKHYRTFAKPTGLGYPGGLGPKTFIQYAKATFGIIVESEELAAQLRDIWKKTFPEMPNYFDYITEYCFDPHNDEKYAYMSFFGMQRSGCDYCAAANGLGLQTPGSEGALNAVNEVMRQCYDWSACNELLYGQVFPNMFVHDEILGEVPDDELASQRVAEIQRIMEDAFNIITPDVKIKTEAKLMRRWNKFAEPVYDDQHNLIVWEETNGQ